MTEEGRINGNLNLSRSIGDLIYKSNPALAPTSQARPAPLQVAKQEAKSRWLHLVVLYSIFHGTIALIYSLGFDLRVLAWVPPRAHSSVNLFCVALSS